jgi:hypothetical protein
MSQPLDQADPGPQFPPMDIVIVGGGMAGVMAALAAKTPSNRVLIIEPSNVLGGQGTAGGVAGFCGDTEHVNEAFAELVRRLSSCGMIEPYRPNDDRRSFDLEWCAFFLQEMLVECGVEVLLHSRVIKVRSENGRVTQVTLATTSGLAMIEGKFFIDASGACILPLLAGFPVVHEGANRQLPMSLYFTLWDTGKAISPVLPIGCPRWSSDLEIPMTSLHFFPSGKVEVKMKVVGFDAADARSRSAAEIFARRQMHGLIFYLQTKGYRGKKLDTHVLASVSRAIGVREERRIIGEHVLTESEARRAVVFSDAIAVNTYHIDFHWPDRMERAGTGVTDMLDPHHLPLRMMIPKGAINLLVPGRGASADQLAMSAFRVMAVVAQMGFAAGQAARQCVALGTDLVTIDVGRLQAAIEASGQSLNLSDYGDYLRRDLFTHETIFEGRAIGAGCTAPALARGRNGKFWAAWCGQSEAEAGHLQVWFTERHEHKWSVPRNLAEFPGQTGSAPSLGLDRSGQLELVVSSCAGDTTRTTWTLTSSDEGISWEPIRREVGTIETAPKPLAWPTGARGNEGAFATLTDGTLALAYVEFAGAGPAQLKVALSADGGRSWPHCRAIAPGDADPSCPAAVSTRTGLAIAYLADGPRLRFWHGSVERIIDGPPAAPAHTDLNIVA